jgi:uncharacterized protein (DUF1778 family)
MKGKRTGRPKKEESREKPLRIRLTAAEREILDAAANHRGLDTSTWARMILLDTAKGMKAGAA